MQKARLVMEIMIFGGKKGWRGKAIGRLIFSGKREKPWAVLCHRFLCVGVILCWVMSYS